MIEALRSRCSSLQHILVIESMGQKHEPFPEGTLSFNELLGKVDLTRYPRDYLQSFRPNPEEICHLMPTRGCAPSLNQRRGGTISFEEIISYLKEKKTSVLYLLERIELIEEMPPTNVGKVDKKRLREETKEKLRKEGKI